MIPGDHLLHEQIPLSLANTVGIILWGERDILGQCSTESHAVDGPGTHMYETTHACCQSRPAHMFSASDIHLRILLYRQPYTMQGRQVEHCIHVAHRGDQRLRFADIAAIDRNPALL